MSITLLAINDVYIGDLWPFRLTQLRLLSVCSSNTQVDGPYKLEPYWSMLGLVARLMAHARSGGAESELCHIRLYFLCFKGLTNLKRVTIDEDQWRVSTIIIYDMLE